MIWWIVRAILYDGTETAHNWDTAGEAGWHALGLMVGSYPAQQVTIERYGDVEGEK